MGHSPNFDRLVRRQADFSRADGPHLRRWATDYAPPIGLEAAYLFANGCDCLGDVCERGAVFVEDGLEEGFARLAKRRVVAGGREEQSGQLLGGVEAAA